MNRSKFLETLKYETEHQIGSIAITLAVMTAFAILLWFFSPDMFLVRTVNAGVETGVVVLDATKHELKRLGHEQKVQHLIECGWTPAQAENLIGPE